MRATKSLPAEYQSYTTVSLQRNKGLLILLTVLGALLAGFFTWIFLLILQHLRSDTVAIAHQFYTSTPTEYFTITLDLFTFITAAAAIMLIAPIHEAVHGIFFWLFTGTRPTFAYKLLYAYAAAPDWYIPRGPYLVIGLAPFALLTAIGIALMPILPSVLIPALLLFMVFNAAGAVGDLAVCLWLLFQPIDLLARDAGDVLTLYRHTSTPVQQPS